MEHFEIERKYIIAMPDEKTLGTLCREKGGEVWNIVQIYLKAPQGESARVRRVECDRRVTYIRTEKTHVTAMKRVEREWEIGGDEYLAAIADADPEYKPITKTRYRIPDGGHMWEVDVFPFWKRQAFLEVELSAEDEACNIPDFVKVIREVTGDRAYTNHSLARMIPEED